MTLAASLFSSTAAWETALPCKSWVPLFQGHLGPMGLRHWADTRGAEAHLSGEGAWTIF